MSASTHDRIVDHLGPINLTFEHRVVVVICARGACCAIVDNLVKARSLAEGAEIGARLLTSDDLVIALVMPDDAEMINEAKRALPPEAGNWTDQVFAATEECVAEAMRRGVS